MKKSIVIAVLLAMSTFANAGVIKFTTKKAVAATKVAVKAVKAGVKTTAKVIY